MGSHEERKRQGTLNQAVMPAQAGIQGSPASGLPPARE